MTPDDLVESVLRTSGLAKPWTVTETREEAANGLGVSHSVVAEQRERTMLVVVSLPCAIIAALSLVPMFVTGATHVGVNSQLTGLLFSAAALATGYIAVFRQEGIRHRPRGATWSMTNAMPTRNYSFLTEIR